MQLVVQYLDLQSALLSPYTSEHDEIPVTIDQMAGFLYCSNRNVKFLLKKMIEQGWIHWQPGRGRGNHSAIRFLASASELLIAEAKVHVEKGNLKAAMGLLQLPGVDPFLREPFMSWLSDFFGYNNNNCSEQGIDILRLPMRSPMIGLDPADLFYSRDLHFAKQIFDTLVRFDPATSSLVPHLAHHWEMNENGTLWTFYLKKGVMFHHGRGLTSSDAAYSFLRLKEKGESSPNGWLAEHIISVQTPNKYALQIQLDAPNYMFSHYVSSFPMSIVPEDVYRSNHDVNHFPVGTGPFQVIRNDEGSFILEAFDGYFRERAYLDRIEMFRIPQEMMDHKQNDWNYHIGKAYDFKLPTPANWKTINIMPLGCNLLAFNLRKPGPQQDAKFREAIHHVLDRQRLVAELGMEGDLPALGFMPPNSPQRGRTDSLPNEAKRLLAASSYRGETLRLSSLIKHRNQSEWIRERCESIGIQVAIEEITYEESAQREHILNLDGSLMGVVADDDIARCLLEMYKISNLPFVAFAPDEFRQTLNERVSLAISEPNADLRLNLIREIEHLLTDDHRVLFLTHSMQRTLFSPDVKGVSLNSLGWFDFKDIWFKPKSTEMK